MSEPASGPAKPPEPAPPPAYGKAAMVDLADHIEWSSSEVLNAAGSSSLQNVLKQGTREQKEMLLESDADEQVSGFWRVADKYNFDNVGVSKSAGEMRPSGEVACARWTNAPPSGARRRRGMVQEFAINLERRPLACHVWGPWCASRGQIIMQPFTTYTKQLQHPN